MAVKWPVECEKVCLSVHNLEWGEDVFSGTPADLGRSWVTSLSRLPSLLRATSDTSASASLRIQISKGPGGTESQDQQCAKLSGWEGCAVPCPGIIDCWVWARCFKNEIKVYTDAKVTRILYSKQSDNRSGKYIVEKPGGVRGHRSEGALRLQPEFLLWG